MPRKITEEPLDFAAWCYETDIEERHRQLVETYGDAAPLLSVYTRYRYEEYTERFRLASAGSSVDLLQP